MVRAGNPDPVVPSYSHSGPRTALGTRGGPAVTHISGLALAAASALLLTACSGTPATSTANPAVTTSAVQSDTTGSAVPGTAAPVSGADVCGYLRGQIPTLAGIGSEVGAMANLTTNLYSWYEKQGVVPDGAQIDKQVQQECPDVAAQVYELAGITGFASL
ncbi:hypothetical protein [Umezawaea sp. Da 62-37]|uniref:hypothetical protein n=1 Tax=Umezawaea sp. Da 62-37 TaxID=3075927 RepID=UPI0028F6D382|nr:hypothetical protein [Umezawaea sp. Da 62-37]WNV87104.1 hypothetical protein RM788_02075 [Umezawaea sp. Da 62-37]